VAEPELDVPELEVPEPVVVEPPEVAVAADEEPCVAELPPLLLAVCAVPGSS
jgi:hypothetical protein